MAKESKVSLYGEVKFPGEYDIRKGESLRELIERAGGLTEYSYSKGAVFTREKLRFQQQQQLNKLSEDLRRDIASKSFNNSVTDSTLSYQDMTNLINDLAKVKAVGRLVIDLPAVVDGNIDIPLENNDMLYIPSKQNSINVVGEVNFSSSHLFDASLSYEDYIARSGGLKQRADEDRIYIIKASGLVSIPKNNSCFANRTDILEPGDTIVVPLNTEHVDNLTLWSTATQILYQMGIAVAAVGSL
ncbi:SLBB domain-containing protein [Pseudoalteromonas espejiana]